MPTKNIYVADADLALFERAAELAGGMSSAVVAGLRLYIDRKEREMQGFKQIEVEVNDGPLVVTKRFHGRRLFKLEHKEGVRVTSFRVYATARNQFAVYHRDDPDWSPGDDAAWENPETWRPDHYTTRDRTLRVFPDVESMEEELPHDVIDALRNALSKPAVEDLDI